MRHSCAALLIAQGAHPEAIQVHLGHSSIQVTMDRYGHLFPSEWEGLAERLDQMHQATLKGTSLGTSPTTRTSSRSRRPAWPGQTNSGAGWT